MKYIVSLLSVPRRKGNPVVLRGTQDDNAIVPTRVRQVSYTTAPQICLDWHDCY